MGAEFGLVWCCFLLPLHPRYYSAYCHGHRRNADSLESTTNSGNFQGEIGIRTLDSFSGVLSRLVSMATLAEARLILCSPIAHATHPLLRRLPSLLLMSQLSSLLINCPVGLDPPTPPKSHLRRHTGPTRLLTKVRVLAGSCTDARVPYTMLLLRPLLLISYPKYLAFNLRSTSSIES